MSKQIGPINLDGRVGNISFHYKKGKASASLKPRGLSKERIENDPKLHRVRENISEFRGQAAMTSSFAAALATAIALADGTLRPRLMRVFTKVKNRSGGERGQRAFSLSQFKSSFKGFELNAQSALSRVLLAPSGAIVSTPSATRNSASLQVTIDYPDKQIIAPPEATHVQIIHLLGVISDREFDLEEGSYMSLEPTVDGVSALSTSAPIELGTHEPVSVSLETTLPLETIPEKATVIEALGIESFQEVSGTQYPLKQGCGMKIINVF